MQPDTEPPADPPPDIEALLRQLRNWNPQTRADAAERLHRRASRRDVVGPLVALANEETRRRHRRRLFALPVLGLALYVGVHLGPYLPDRNGWLRALATTCLTWYLMSSSGSHRDALTILKEMDDVRAIGPLAEMLTFRDAFLIPLSAREARDAIIGLLPRLRASDAHLLNDVQRNSLYRALSRRDRPLQDAILRALEQIGGTRAIPYVEKLIASRKTAPEIRRLAEDVLPALRERAELERTGAHLLRPAQTDDSALLHPASAVSSNNTPLVRASEEPDRQVEVTIAGKVHEP